MFRTCLALFGCLIEGREEFGVVVDFCACGFDHWNLEGRYWDILLLSLPLYDILDPFRHISASIKKKKALMIY